MSGGSGRALHRLALWTTIGMVVLLAAGASVNSLGGALSVPDWPLSYGRLLPLNFVGHATHEQAHRLVAGALVLLIGVLAVAVARRERRPWVRAIGYWTVGLYYFQVLLGGLVVLALSPPGVVPLHLLLAQVTLGLAFVLTVVTAPGWVEEAAAPAGSSVPRLVTSVLYLAVGQIVLGTLSRHPPAGQGLFISTLLLHLAGALALAVLAGVLVVASGRGGVAIELRKGAGVLLLLVILQLGVGMPLFVVAPEPFSEVWQAPRSFSYLHISHVVLAGLLLAQAAVLKVRLMRATAAAAAA